MKIKGDNAEKPVIMNIPTKEMMLKLNENKLKINLTFTKNIVIMNQHQQTIIRKFIMNTLNIDRLEMIRIAVEKQYANNNK